MSISTNTSADTTTGWAGPGYWNGPTRGWIGPTRRWAGPGYWMGPTR